MAQQQSIGGGQDTKPNPAEFGCEWCESTATVAVERQRSVKGARGATVGTGQFIMACYAHKETAEALAKSGPK